MTVEHVRIQRRRRAAVDPRDYRVDPVRRVGEVAADLERTSFNIADHLSVGRIDDGGELNRRLDVNNTSQIIINSI